MKVKNMTSTNGNKVPNQFVIIDADKVTFQSYNSEIITLDYTNLTMYIGNDWDYSVTTNKYRNLFMYDYGFANMANKKDFGKIIDANYYCDAIGRNWKIIKEWEV